jgi:hypothetical protein
MKGKGKVKRKVKTKPKPKTHRMPGGGRMTGAKHSASSRPVGRGKKSGY